jgi:phosphate:Na+ symporter
MVLGGSSFDMRLVVYATIVLAVALIYTKKNANLGDFLIGLSLMLLGLTTLKINATEMKLDQIDAVRTFFDSTSSWGYGSYFLYLLVGGILTFAVQSSAAIMAITMTLCSVGVLPIDMGISLVLGENIGTTITSNIVALSASVQARRAAMAHLVFNLFGVIWVLIVFRPFVGLVCKLWGIPFEPGVRPENGLSPEKLSAILATFHTMFNVINTCILIGFIPLLEKWVCVIIPSKPEGDEDSTLKFITGGLMSTSELSIMQAWHEVHVFGVRTRRMIDMVSDLFHTNEEQDFVKIYSRIEKYEGICDRMEVEIAAYLNQVADGRLSDQSKHEVHKMLRIVSELESVGDANFNLSRYISYRHRDRLPYTEEQNRNIEMMESLLAQAANKMVEALDKVHISDSEFVEMMRIETEINNFRDDLKAENTLNVTGHVYDYLTGVNYMDTISEFEKMGDYIINVEEAIYEKKHDK